MAGFFVALTTSGKRCQEIIRTTRENMAAMTGA
jgi:hypothetical protein